ncbi:NYN domain-containing protein [Microbacterium sp. KKR3/1]|uniref:NYN domain-containing protein n=1 Tax=Microbacterium sp. KKR3/1 TaxID=2904241 RepID=UPI001E4B601C|nr:NYN domain-containing protein [Microbacterium sp. KKR3/1]MCE0510829.1 NYN domain-containing protein [Microbacterium sp. KKR3/1]
MAERVVVFFDWQNIYKRAREAFGYDDSPAYKGQADPIDLALLLAGKHAENMGVEVELTQIRIYRGRPTQQHDPRGYNAFQRQAARWSRNNKVRPRFNDLRYPEDWGEPGCAAPREKGIDVALAVDLVSMAHNDDMDVAIVMSADYDLVPAIQEVVTRRIHRGVGPVVSVAAWKSEHNGRPLRIRLQSDALWCHWLSEQDFWSVEDDTDYGVAPPNTSTVPVPGPPRLR